MYAGRGEAAPGVLMTEFLFVVVFVVIVVAAWFVCMHYWCDRYFSYCIRSLSFSRTTLRVLCVHRFDDDDDGEMNLFLLLFDAVVFVVVAAAAMLLR